MNECNIKAGLLSLRESLKRIQDLSAWQQLKQAEERPGQVPGFAWHDPVAVDLRDEYSFFLKTSLELHTCLQENKGALPLIQRRRLQEKLLALDKQVRAMHLADTFINL